jgi:hypothetical protein
MWSVTGQPEQHFWLRPNSGLYSQVFASDFVTNKIVVKEYKGMVLM